MVAVPVAIPLTVPVVLTEAIAALLLLQVPPAVASASVIVAPVQTEVAPVIAATAGNGFTVTVAVA